MNRTGTARDVLDWIAFGEDMNTIPRFMSASAQRGYILWLFGLVD